MNKVIEELTNSRNRFSFRCCGKHLIRNFNLFRLIANQSALYSKDPPELSSCQEKFLRGINPPGIPAVQLDLVIMVLYFETIVQIYILIFVVVFLPTFLFKILFQHSVGNSAHRSSCKLVGDMQQCYMAKCQCAIFYLGRIWLASSSNVNFCRQVSQGKSECNIFQPR